MYPVYSFEHIMQPVWSTETVWFEGLTMVEENGTVSAPMLYEAEEIIAVQSADLTQWYEEGVDYEYRDGRLWLTSGSRIFYFRHEEMFLEEEVPGWCFPMEKGYLLFHEGHFFHDRQLAVTYRCKKCDWPGKIPAFVGKNLPKTMEKLKAKQKINLVLYGDSISEGANASGIMGASPFLPIWGRLVTEQLQRHYGGQVWFKNPSLGGMDAIWGANNVEERVCKEEPDLVIIAFGANDGIAGQEFYDRIAAIIAPIREKCPEAEILLVATLVPNPILDSPKAKFYNEQMHQGKELAKFVGEGIAMVDIHQVQLSLMERKRFVDMTGNNVNHPNDFMVRIYAQTVSAALIENFGGTK